MPTLHSTLTGSDLHEPKGASTAPASTVYVANGSGSGNWLSTHAYGTMYIDKDSATHDLSLPAALDSTFNTNTDYRKLVGTNMWSSGENSNITLDPTNGDIVITKSGVYQFSFCIAHKIATTASRVLAWKCVMNNITFSDTKLIDTTTGASNIYSVSATKIKALTAGDKISIYVACSAADTLQIVDASFAAILVKAT